MLLERLVGKRLGADFEPATIVAASPRRIRVQTASEIAVFDDVRLTFGEVFVYGKVVGVGEDGVVVHLTGGDVGVRERLAAG